MLKKYSQLIIGIVIGFILASSVVFGEDIIRNAYFNGDLKLAINGQEVEDIRIVTVELEGEQYGRNYYSIADLIKALNDYGGISAKVDFDSATKTTVVEVERKEDDLAMVTPTPTPAPLTYEELMKIIESNRQKETQMTEDIPVKNEPVINRYTQDGIEIVEVDGQKYVNSKEIERVLREYFGNPLILLMPKTDMNFLFIANFLNMDIIKDSEKPPERKTVPKELTDLKIPYNNSIDIIEYYIEYEFFTANILPYLK